MKRIKDGFDEPVLIAETEYDELYAMGANFNDEQDGEVTGRVRITQEFFGDEESDGDSWVQSFTLYTDRIDATLNSRYEGERFIDLKQDPYMYVWFDEGVEYSKTARVNLDKFIIESYYGDKVGYDEARGFLYPTHVSDSRRTRSLGQRIKDSVKAKNIRRKITDAKAKYFTNDLKRMQAYRRVTDSTGKIKENVVFLIEDSDVLAVFPNTYGTANRDRDTMVCYSHNGQHGVCTYDYANTLKTADSKQYNELKDELANYVGYNLTIVDSLPSEAELKQNGKEIRDSYIKYKRGLQIADERMLARGEEIEYKGKRGTVQYALFHGTQPVVIRWTNEDGSEEFEIPYNEVNKLKIHDSEDDTDNDIDANVEPVDNDSDIDDAEVTDNCGGKKKTKKKTADGVKRVKITKRQNKKTE